MSVPLSPTVSACSSSESPKVVPVRQLGGHPSARRRLSPTQTRALISVFEVKTHPSREERALLAAELGMELKAVNAWFQNKRRTLKRTWSSTCGWSKGSLPENKHVPQLDGPKSQSLSESAISLERVASSHELPYKPRKAAHSSCRPRPPMTPRRRTTVTATAALKDIWELLPSSPPTRPSSPTQGEPLLTLEPCAKKSRLLEWACAKARVGRRASARTKAPRTPRDSDADSDVPMLVLDAAPRDKHASSSSGDDDDTETEEDEAITPNVSTELLPPFIVAEMDEGKRHEKNQKMDMEAAIALLGFMAPEMPA